MKYINFHYRNHYISACIEKFVSSGLEQKNCSSVCMNYVFAYKFAIAIIQSAVMIIVSVNMEFSQKIKLWLKIFSRCFCDT